ncbi:MAG TPA: hypothetical protein EYP41_16360 [Anaerolineae bacterium]|nr:hypothetical protein [Anaerolineae bacterium]
MPTITVDSKLYKQLEEVAQTQQSKPEDIADEAFRLYLWEQSRRKIAEESASYRLQHNALKTKYLGQYIAMRQGEVVDHDPDFTALYGRVRQRYGQTPVMITRVEDQPEMVYTRRGFRIEQ